MKQLIHKARWSDVLAWADTYMKPGCEEKSISGDVSRFFTGKTWGGRWYEGISTNADLLKRIKHPTPAAVQAVDELILDLKTKISPPIRYRKRGSHRRSYAGARVDATAYGSFTRDPRPVHQRDGRIYRPVVSKRRTARTVKITLDTCHHCAESQATIANRVGVVMAVSEILESHGIGTEIRALTAVRGAYKSFHGVTIMDTSVKSGGDPINRLALIAAICDIGVWRLTALPMSVGATLDRHGIKRWGRGEKPVEYGFGTVESVPANMQGEIHIKNESYGRDWLIDYAKREVERLTAWQDRTNA